MNLISCALIGVGLAMDAVAVSIGKGLAAGKVRLSHCLTAGVYFGGFQALMPFIGYWVGSLFASRVDQFDHWVAFILLALIGGNMIRESFGEEENTDAAFGVGAMLPLAVATSIDALAVGVTFSFDLSVGTMLWAILLIGVITFGLSALGVWVGGVFGAKHKKTAERIGGAILILMGLKILLEGLGIIAF